MRPNPPCSPRRRGSHVCSTPASPLDLVCTVSLHSPQERGTSSFSVSGRPNDVRLTAWVNRQYYSPGLQRWVHLDSCECARDETLLYDRGWGKKMSYVLAFSTDGATDVSRAYIQDWAAALQRRRRLSEGELTRVRAAESLSVCLVAVVWSLAYFCPRGPP